MGHLAEVEEQLLLTVVEAAAMLEVGRTKAYELIAGGELQVVHIGRAARVPLVAVHRYVEALLSRPRVRCDERLATRTPRSLRCPSSISRRTDGWLRSRSASRRPERLATTFATAHVVVRSRRRSSAARTPRTACARSRASGSPVRSPIRVEDARSSPTSP